MFGDRQVASSRLQGFLVHEQLARVGYNSEIVRVDARRLERGLSWPWLGLLFRICADRYSIVVFQKPGWMMFKLSEVLRQAGVRTISIQCDPFPGPYERYFDHTVVTTTRLARMLDVERAEVIDDMIEVPPDAGKSDFASHGGKLKVVWIGQGTGSGGRRFIEPFIESLGRHPDIAEKVEFVTISRGSWPTRQWSLDSVFSDICACDVAIVPLPSDQESGFKSSNRMATFMALGMPVIVTPIESYRGIGVDGETCLFANDSDGFARAILACTEPETRRRLGMAAREQIWQRLAPEAIVAKWASLVDRTLSSRPQRALDCSASAWLLSVVARVYRTVNGARRG